MFQLYSSLLKAVNLGTCELLASVFNKCAEKTYYPKVLKTAKVIPIFKSGEKDNPQNYRPISLLPVIGKVFVKLTYARIKCFLIQHNILSERQFGFRNKRKTVDAIAILTEHIRLGLDSLDERCSVFLDLTKAFDTVDHNLLLLKCERYGLRGCVYHLLKLYLSDRKQFVQTGDKKSAVLDFKYGVPQGSVLGPLLFLLYINDIERVCQSSEIILFADDTTIYSSNKLNNDDLLNVLGRLCDWFDRNKMTVNFSKCNMTCFAKRETVRRLQLQGITLFNKESTKYFGVHIDKKTKL